MTANGSGGATWAPNSAALPTGSLVIWSTNSAPSGYLLCDGAAVSRTTYSTLFAVIGTAYGQGDGSTTFNLPDFRGRVPVGRDSGQGEFDALAETGGEKLHTLTIDEMPSHSHAVPAINVVTASGYAGAEGRQYSDGSIASAATGGGGAHNNLQPFLVVNYVIKM